MLFAKLLSYHELKIYGFDSFEGLEEDWITHEFNPAGTFTLNKKIPKVLNNVKIIIALGKIAFDACIKFYKGIYFLKNKDYLFGHGAKYQLPDKKILIGCYHPSPRNVNTKRINYNMMLLLLKKIKKKLIN